MLSLSYKYRNINILTKYILNEFLYWWYSKNANITMNEKVKKTQEVVVFYRIIEQRTKMKNFSQISQRIHLIARMRTKKIQKDRKISVVTAMSWLVERKKEKEEQK